MFPSLNQVDWDLLHQQKQALVRLLAAKDPAPAVKRSAPQLQGIVHLLDTLQDDAAAAGRWAFPGERAAKAAVSRSIHKRYYVEDDDGHHHGPISDYEEAASVAEAVQGRIIVQGVDGPSTPEDTSKGPTAG
jgi:hypothetical protein